MPAGSYFFRALLRRSISPEIAKSSSVRFARPSSRRFHQSPYHSSSAAVAFRRFTFFFLKVIRRGIFGNKPSWAPSSMTCRVFFDQGLDQDERSVLGQLGLHCLPKLLVALMMQARISSAGLSPTLSNIWVCAVFAKSRNLFLPKPFMPEDFSAWLVLVPLRFAGRSLARTPAFTAIVLLVIAVGIGVNTAVFSVVDAVLLKPLTYPDPDALVRLVTTGDRGQFR